MSLLKLVSQAEADELFVFRALKASLVCKTDWISQICVQKLEQSANQASLHFQMQVVDVLKYAVRSPLLQRILQLHFK